MNHLANGLIKTPSRPANSFSPQYFYVLMPFCNRFEHTMFAFILNFLFSDVYLEDFY